MPVLLCDECRTADGVEKYANAWYCHACNTKTKECRRCLAVKSIHEFEKNQRTPNGMRNRRSECKACRKSRKPVSARIRKQFELSHPPPRIGDTFQCPVCLRISTVTTSQSVNLDHDSSTGEVRGYVCGDCNTGMGKLQDDTSILARAIVWIQSVGRGLKNFM